MVLIKILCAVKLSADVKPMSTDLVPSKQWECMFAPSMCILWPLSGNTKGGSITVLLTSCLTGLESAVWQLTIFVFICIKQTTPNQSNRRSMVQWYFPPLVFPASMYRLHCIVLIISWHNNFEHKCFVLLADSTSFFQARKKVFVLLNKMTSDVNILFQLWRSKLECFWWQTLPAYSCILGWRNSRLNQCCFNSKCLEVADNACHWQNALAST